MVSGMLVMMLTVSGVPDSWVNRTAYLESRHDRMAVGDSGKSRGAFQIRRSVWEHYSTVAWREGAHNPREARRVAKLILEDCARACRRDGKPVTFKNVRFYYRRGGF